MIRRCWLIGLAAATPLAAQDTIVVRLGTDLTALQGDTLVVPVVADMQGASGARLGSYTVRVTWDRTALRYTGFRDGSFAVPVARTDSVSQGVLWLTGVSPAGRDGLVHLADVRFRVDFAASDSVRLQVTEMSAAGTLADLLVTATIQVLGGGFCPAMGRWGDLDGDRQANSRDALAILSNLVNLPAPPGFNVTLGDVDGDGLTNSRDALIVLSYSVG
ncbi:MAG TPA: dockerin type I domain-containing protein, partial [Gemmatimonadales bacterium]|nr:dockerin type I domain-containing protein [Gemmatimonadales bacterium]